MIRCHECDSNVAENDLFCPFCGVALQGSSAAEVPSNDMSVSDTATTEPSVADIPVPDLLADWTATSDNAVPPSTSEFSFDAHEPAQGLLSDEPVPADKFSGPIDPPSGDKPGIFDERPHYTDDSISRPQQELEENPGPNSMFDSVRIMESKPQDDVDTRIQGTSDPTPQPPVPAVLSGATGAAPKPYTEPNLGVGGDTAGKRSKLKPLSEGTVLNGRYEIVRPLGRGRLHRSHAAPPSGAAMRNCDR